MEDDGLEDVGRVLVLFIVAFTVAVALIYWFFS